MSTETPKDSSNETIPRGIKWTYRDVRRGKYSVALVICMVLITLFSIYAYISSVANGSTLGIVTSLADGVAQMKVQEIGLAVAEMLVIMLPFVIIFFPILLLILKAAYTLRDRNLPCTPENLAAHEREASPHWLWPASIIVGAIDFTALFSAYDAIMVTAGISDIASNSAVLSLIVGVVCLVFAERRARRLSRGMAAYLPGNHLLISEVAKGEHDAELPEALQTEFGRAQVACVLSLGVVRTLPWAVRIVKGISLRTRVKLFSGFLNSTIHGIITAFSFGIAATVANETGAVAGQFVAGNQDAYLEKLATRAEKRPRFIIEVICFIWCIVYVTVTLMPLMFTATGA